MRKIKKITCKIVIDTDGKQQISVHGGAGDTRELAPIAAAIIEPIRVKLLEQLKEHNER